jgi:hypothetical protein
MQCRTLVIKLNPEANFSDYTLSILSALQPHHSGPSSHTSTATAPGRTGSSGGTNQGSPPPPPTDTSLIKLTLDEMT